MCTAMWVVDSPTRWTQWRHTAIQFLIHKKNSKWSVRLESNRTSAFVRALRLILKIFLVRSIFKNIQLKPWNHKLEHKNNSMIFGFVGKSSINISKHCLYIHAVNSLNCNKKIKKNFIRQSSWVVKVMTRIVIKIDMCLASITNIWHPPI